MTPLGSFAQREEDETSSLVSGSSQAAVEFQQDAQAKTTPSIAIIAVAPYPQDDHLDAWIKNGGVDPINAMEKLDVTVITAETRSDTMTYSADGRANTWVEEPVGSAICAIGHGGVGT